MELTIKLDPQQLALICDLVDKLTDEKLKKHVRKWHRKGG